jgi:hypothetical protein
MANLDEFELDILKSVANEKVKAISLSVLKNYDQLSNIKRKK